jgi:hypothetical protein
MADQTVTMDATPPRAAASTAPQITVLAALAATGTLATNILLPSLPQMAVSLKVSSAAGASALSVRRESRCGLRAARLLPDDECRDRGMAHRDRFT